jgi:hypothetical protein
MVFAPFVVGCSTPRVAEQVGIKALKVSEVVFSVDKPNTDLRELTLTMGGTAEGNATWAIENSSVPAWLSLDALNGPYTTAANVPTPFVAVTALTSGFLERPENYEAKLRLTVSSRLDVVFEIPVMLQLSARVEASFSAWGTIDAPVVEGGARLSCTSAPAMQTSLVIDKEARFFFTSCDRDAMPVAHSLPSIEDTRAFVASVRQDNIVYSADVVPQTCGVYYVTFVPVLLGDYVATVSLNGEPLGAGSLPFAVSCADGRAQIPGTKLCGCPRGSVLRDDRCRPCDTSKSAESGETDCTRCDKVRP